MNSNFCIDRWKRQPKIEIAIIIGTRAEYIKMFPVMLELQKVNKGYYFMHTGQHDLSGLCETFGTKRPDIILSKEPTNSSKFDTKESKAIKWSLEMIFKIRKELRKLPGLKYVLYHGDTISTCSAAIASSNLLNPKKTWKNAHLEAGLRSYNNKEPFPEEIIRKICDKFSDILIIPSDNMRWNLTRLKNKETYNLGNTIVDSANIAMEMGKRKNINPLNKKFALISVHRHENIKNSERLKNIVEILHTLRIPAYFTLHDNTKKQLIKFGLYHKLVENKNIKIIKPMDYVSMIAQINNCSLLIADGGSIQEESLIFSKPIIILRMNTERQEGLDSNFQYLSKLNVEKTSDKIKEYLSEDFKIEPFKNPYGEIGVSKKIVGLLK